MNFINLAELIDVSRILNEYENSKKKMLFYTKNYTLFVVLLHNIQLQSDSEAQPIGYLIRRKLCQSQ